MCDKTKHSKHQSYFGRRDTLLHWLKQHQNVPSFPLSILFCLLLAFFFRQEKKGRKKRAIFPMFDMSILYCEKDNKKSRRDEQNRLLTNRFIIFYFANFSMDPLEELSELLELLGLSES